MHQGKICDEKAKLDILDFARVHPSFTAEELVRALKGKYTKTTIIKYRKELEKEGSLNTRVSTEGSPLRINFVVSKKGRDFAVSIYNHLTVNSAKMIWESGEAHSFLSALEEQFEMVQKSGYAISIENGKPVLKKVPAIWQKKEEL